MSAPEDDVAAHLPARLTTLGFPGYTLGANVRSGRVQLATAAAAVASPVPHECIFVLGTGGIRDTPWKSDVVGELGLSRPSVQVTIRGNVNKWTATRDLADAVWRSLDKSPPAGYLESRAQSSQAIWVHEDESGHPTWTVNLLLIRQV